MVQFQNQVDFVEEALKNASKSLENANIGMRRDNLYKIMVFKSQIDADAVRG